MIPAYLAPIANHVWQSTVFAGVAALLTLALRNNQARIRHALWLCASAKFLVPFSLLIAIGGSFGFLSRTPADSGVAPARVPVVIEDMLSPVAIPGAPAQPIAPLSRNWTGEVLLAIWAFGFAVVLLKWMREWVRIRAIVQAARVVRRLGFQKKMLLAMAGVATVAGPIAIGVIYAPWLRAQPVSEPTVRLPFEVASVKANTKDDIRTVGGEFQILPGGRLSVKNWPLWWIIKDAYELGEGPLEGGGPGERLTGGPEWIRTERFDIEAVADKNAISGDKTFDERADKVHVMLQTLLADRFKLVIRREVREMPVYAIVVAKGGPKFERSKVEEKDCERPVDESTPEGKTLCHAWDFVREGASLLVVRKGAAVDMSDLVSSISGSITDRPVVDKTGLKGLFKMEYVAPKSMDAEGYSVRPSIYEAFEKLGLKLEPQKAPVEMYVIESVERPTAN